MLLSLLLAAPLAHADEVTDLYNQLQVWRPARLAEAPQIPESAYRTALGGEPTRGVDYRDDRGRGWGLMLVQLPIEQLWRAITDSEHHELYLAVSDSRILSGAPGDRLIYQEMELPLLSDRWWVVNQRYNGALYSSSGGQAWELHWEDRLDEPALLAEASPPEGGEPIAGTNGSWLLIDLGEDRTLLEYYAWSDPGGAIPSVAAARFAANAVLDTMNRAESMAREHTCSTSTVRPDGSPL